MGSAYKGFNKLVAVAMTHQCTIARPVFPRAPSFTRSLILRPRSPSSYALPRSAASATMTTQDNHLEAIFTQKRAVRSKIKKDLRLMDPALRSQEDDAIQKLILEAPWFKSSKGLCAYISCSALREVDTSKILQHVLHNPTQDGETETAKRLYVPRVEDKNCYMRMLNISGMDDLIANSMNILEPAPVDANGNDREDVMLANEPVDLLLLPGLGFDKTGRRLGRGGGYYDTFLSKYQELARQRNWKQPLLGKFSFDRVQKTQIPSLYVSLKETYDHVTNKLVVMFFVVALSYSVQIVEEGVIPVTPSDVFIDALVSPSGFIPISSVAQQICH